MIEVNHFGEVTQIRMGREGGGDMPWGVAGQALYWTAAYLVDGLLIDTGCPHTAEELVGFLEGQNLKLAVNTHYHEDHIGANALLQKESGLRIFASRESVPLIRQPPKIRPYQELVWGYPAPTEVEPLGDTVKTEHFCFDVVDTPGHSRGHIALVEPVRGWCFSGDLFVSTQPKSVRPEEDVGEIARSMQKLVDLRVETLTLFTSLGTVVPDGREALKSCIQYIHDLARRAKELERLGLKPAAIRDEVFGRETILAAFSEGDITSENMIRAALRASF